MDNHANRQLGRGALPPRGETALRGRLSVALATAALTAACSRPADEAPLEDAGTTPTQDVPNQTVGWDVQTVAGGDVGLHLRLDTHDDTLGLAYFALSGEESGDCTELGDEPPPRVEWALHYATDDGGGWSTEEVSREPFVGQPSGLDISFDGSGTPHVATMIGTPREQIRYCGVNDVGLFRRDSSGWTSETAVATSGEAASGFEPSDYGEVVGYWPALSFDKQDRPAVVYKDVHAGGLQSDDFKRADLEFAKRDGGWSAIPLDFGNGAGNYNDMMFDDRGRPIVVTVNPVEATSASEHGLWVYRATDESGSEWARAQLHNQGTVDGPSVAVSEEGLHVVFYEADHGYPRLATLPTGGDFETLADWVFQDIGDARWDEGYETSVAVDPNGRLGVAYYRCGRSSAGLGNCDATVDGVVFAWRDADAWYREVVDTTEGFCGRGTRLEFLPDGRPIVAYRCETVTDDGLDTEVRVATRGGPP